MSSSETTPKTTYMNELTLDEVKALWSKTYNTDGKPDWSHIFPYYHDDILFQDSIQKIEGKDEFIELCNRLTKRCKELRMDVLSIARIDNVNMSRALIVLPVFAILIII